MKKFFMILVVITMLFSLAGCSQNKNETIIEGSSPVSSEITDDEPSGTPTSAEPSSTEESSGRIDLEENGTKILVAYFSATGTTKTLAEYAANAMHADLYEIVPAAPYSAADLDYGDKNSRSTIEMNDPACRPAINGSVENMEDYDMVFIGYPIWWGEAPRILSTFMESYDFSGKTIVPFCTSSSSGMGSSARNLHSLCADSANWLDGARIKNGANRTDMVEWINGLGLDITAE